ncbi:hypothetical protein [Thalassomonas sp. RHCl1]|uniref:hypothetical protein n=1 Tax=Thalassomonas sp. RHCl1 TaxID=2995320 RepID=UPI00248B3BD9|nr:hypothetical protein [Thalassomonas sp. RHCl1]
MDNIESELFKLWTDDCFDESNFSEIHEILKKNPSYVDFFVKRIDMDSADMDTLYLLIINVIPLSSCVTYALEKEDWLVDDFVEFEWFNGLDDFSLMDAAQYEQWLVKQKKAEGRSL